MAVADSRFDAALFRESIKFAMNMGLPADTSKRATFTWSPIKTFTGSTDFGGAPLDWNQTPTTNDDPDPFRCDCAVEFSRGGDEANPAGESLEDVRVTITILDADWTLVLANGGGRRPDGVEFDGSKYTVDYVAPPLGIFDVVVYSLHCRSLDEK